MSGQPAFEGRESFDFDELLPDVLGASAERPLHLSMSGNHVVEALALQLTIMSGNV